MTGLGADITVQGGNGMIKVLKKKNSSSLRYSWWSSWGWRSPSEQVPVMWQRGNEEWGVHDKDDNNNRRPPCARAFAEELRICRVIWALRNPVNREGWGDSVSLFRVQGNGDSGPRGW